MCVYLRGLNAVILSCGLNYFLDWKAAIQKGNFLTLSNMSTCFNTRLYTLHTHTHYIYITNDY